MKLGYKLAAEAFGPVELVRQAVLAEQAGFDFVEISDHYHPWLDNQGHSPFAWTVLGAIAAKTSRIGLATGATCPSVRYHPAIIAQAAATLALMSDGRFVLGVGSGERLNEHIVGRGFPDMRARHEMLREALEIIRLLWSGGYRSYEGKHLRLENAQVFDLPEELPLIAVAASGQQSTRIAAELGDCLFATEDRPKIVQQYRDAGGSGPCFAEIPMAWAPDEHTAAKTVREDDVLEKFACGPDPARYVQAAQEFVNAGFDRLVMQNAGPDPDGFIDFYQRELDGPIRQLKPHGTHA
ncbi:TIGR03557 family F420-dependent LLM class oxidoreductase [Streptomyces sp. NPDC005096]|uniref:TIGR03557 family F420-dependent LLM class oxidoreductase n=1 Tax=Streptomyces sp. NPDC005096 TaxID=3154559 RepID=UPI0033AE3050